MAAKRKDPTPRSMDGGGRRWNTIKNRDPEKHYVWAFKANEDTGLQYYLSIGYEIETYREGGPMPAGGKLRAEHGQPIEQRGHVLVSIGMDERRRIDSEGVDGDAGQKMVDAIEQRIITRRGGADLMRGIFPDGQDRGRSGERYFIVQNETGAAPERPFVGA